MHQNPENECTCNICHCNFDIQAEGGIDGFLGVLPFSLCSMCHSGLDMMYTEFHGCFQEDE